MRDRGVIKKEMVIEHKAGPNAVRELATHLYRDPRSAIKEAISNALDQMPRDGRVEIFTDVPPDNDIVIEDWGTGIEDLQAFVTYLTGEKTVLGRKSSYDSFDPDIIGCKGLGKLGYMQLSETETVEFYSHRARREIKDEKGQLIKVIPREGLKLVMSIANFEDEHMDSMDALPHPGLKVVIKHVKKGILPSDGWLMNYISEVFAIRIKNAAKIFLNNNETVAPEDFEAKGFDLFQMSNGDWIKGNLRAVEKPDYNNIKFNIKNVLVERLPFDYKVVGWINDDLLIPTSSRESIETGTPRYKELESRFIDYLSRNYQRRSSHKVLKMRDQKQKEQFMLEMLKFQDELLKGEYLENGIPGQTTLDYSEESVIWKLEENKKLTATGGSEKGDPIIPIGTGHRGDGIIRTPTGEFPSVEDDGDHKIIKREGQSADQKKEQSLIKPRLFYIEKDKGELEDPLYLKDPQTVIVNTFWPQAEVFMRTRFRDWKTLAAMLGSQAIVNWTHKNRKLDSKEWQRYYNSLVRWRLEE